MFTGDIIPAGKVDSLARHYGQGEPGGIDYVPMFGRVAAEIADADVALCHLDATASFDGALSGGTQHRVPGEMLTALAASGWDGCSLASPNALDFGLDGVTDSVASLRRSAISRITSPAALGIAKMI